MFLNKFKGFFNIYFKFMDIFSSVFKCFNVLEHFLQLIIFYSFDDIFNA